MAAAVAAFRPGAGASWTPRFWVDVCWPPATSAAAARQLPASPAASCRCSTPSPRDGGPPRRASRWHAPGCGGLRRLAGRRARLQVGLACRALGDTDAADLEIGAARATFERLAARPDLARLDRLTAGGRPDAGVLTAREREVLRLVATGRTNRDIASVLVISEHTVGRHL